jgi:tRNA(Ile)-lysidine synthase
VHALAERLLDTIQKRGSVRAGDRLAVAVSGGADSVALLFLLLELRTELGIVLSVAHVNHQLRGGESDEDEHFVAELANTNGLELHLCSSPVASRAGIEAAARELRYEFFRQLAREGRVTNIATAHTLDDQAETVLLRIFRGTGIRGLGAIHPRIVFQEQGRICGEVLRPLLGFRRAALHEFLRQGGQAWREDSSNQNLTFLRNRLRHRLLPLIAEEFGEAAIEHMGELAEIARAEEEHWQSAHPEVNASSGLAPNNRHDSSLPLKLLLSLSLAGQRRLVRAWLVANAPDLRISFRLIEEALELARGETGQQLELTAAWMLRRKPDDLSLEPWADRAEARDYEYLLAIPGAVKVPELGASIEAIVVDVDTVSLEDRGQLLDSRFMLKEVLIRNWRAGDRYWPAHTSAAKKVKELLSDRHATGIDKKLWPVAVAEGRGLVWMRGFSVPAALRAPPDSSKAIWIRQIAG